MDARKRAALVVIGLIYLAACVFVALFVSRFFPADLFVFVILGVLFVLVYGGGHILFKLIFKLFNVKR